MSNRYRTYIRYVDMDFVTEQRSGDFVEQRILQQPVPFVCFALEPVFGEEPVVSEPERGDDE